MQIGRHADADEGEFAASGQQKAAFNRGRPRQPEQFAQPDEQQRLDREQSRNAAKQQERLAHQFAKVDIHADSEKEHAEQQAFDRLDRRFDGFAVFGFGKQKSRNERTKGHR